MKTEDELRLIEYWLEDPDNLMKIPEHCIKNTQENKLILSAFKVSISSVDSRNNEICFQTRDSNLIAQINQNAYIKNNKIWKKWRDYSNSARIYGGKKY
jgi:hypothetical protein